MSQDPNTLRELIAFRIGAQEFCVDIMAIREIRGWTASTAMPKAPPFVCGVINLRGTVLPIVDMAQRFGLGRAEPDQKNVIIVAQVGEQVVGLLVDAVSDILSIGQDQIQATPDVASETARSFIRGLIAQPSREGGGRMISLISLDRVLPDLGLEAA